MIFRPELLDALSAQPSGPVEFTAWRHMFGRAAPDVENSRGARWNPAGTPAIYLSRTAEGATAEGDHAVAVQPFRPKARRFLYQVEVTLSNVLDLSEPAGLDQVGLSEADLTDDDFTACQEVGAAVAWLEHDGLLVPSARSGSVNLVIYPDARAADARFEFGPGQAI